VNAKETEIILTLAVQLLIITVIFALAIRALFCFLRTFWKPILCLLSLFIVFVVVIWVVFKIGGLI
jgi:hypothetical protein